MAVLSVRNNNPGNIRDTGIAWEGRTGSSGGFVTFDTPSMGVRAMTKNLYTYQNRGLSTVNQMISTWAPPSENDTRGYVNFVANRMGIDPNTPISLASNPALAQSMIGAMIQMEGGSEASNYFNPHIANGIAIANGTLDPDSIPTIPPTTGGGTAPITDGDTGAGVGQTQPGGEPGGSIGGGGAGGTQQFYEDNVLNKYASFNYKWAVHVIHPRDSQNPTTGNKVTIAESGVEAEINIQAVDQKITLTGKNREAASNNFILELVEPGGMTLYQRVLLAANRLGIENYLQALYVLELKFIGWTDDGGIDSSAAGPFYYVCTLNTSRLEHREGASYYYISLTETQVESYGRIFLHNTEQLKVLDTRTYGEFVTQFEEEINKQEELNVEYGGRLFPTVYKFTFFDGAEDWANWEFSTILEGINDQHISVNSNDKLDFTITPGSSITGMLRLGLFQTLNMQRLPISNGGFGKNEPNDRKAQEGSLINLPSWIKFETVVTYGPYDPLQGDYQKIIEYKIGSQLRPELVHDPESYMQIQTNAGLNSSRLRNMFGNNLIRKKFDYTFTGLNTEVIDFTLNFDQLFFQLQPLRAGTLQYSWQATSGSGDPELNVVNIEEADFNNSKEEVDALTAAISAIAGELETLSSIDTGFQNSLRSRISELNEERGQLEVRQQAAQTALADARTAWRDKLQADFDAGRTIPPTRQGNRYITQSEVRAAYKNPNGANEQRYQFYETKVRNEATEGPDKNREQSAGTVLLGAVDINLNALSDLAQINLLVRGDPYWLGRPRFSNASGADYTRGNQHFFLNINLPTYPEDSTGLVDLEAYDFSVMGLYFVNNVMASYRDGQFTMELDSVRDVMTSVGFNLQQLKTGLVNTGNVGQQPGINSGAGDGGGTGDPGTAPSGPTAGLPASGTGSGNVTQAQSGIRNQPISSSLESILSTAGANAGVDVRVTSGGQPSSGPNRTGSHRHDNGNAADVQLFSNGRQLSLNNANDLPIIQNFITQAKQAGATGFGAGNGYMGDNTFHIDNAYSGLSYWGGPLDPTSGTYISANAPRWLRQIVVGS
jgi:hypothetical protein